MPLTLSHVNFVEGLGSNLQKTQTHNTVKSLIDSLGGIFLQMQILSE